MIRSCLVTLFREAFYSSFFAKKISDLDHRLSVLSSSSIICAPLTQQTTTTMEWDHHATYAHVSEYGQRQLVYILLRGNKLKEVKLVLDKRQISHLNQEQGRLLR